MIVFGLTLESLSLSPFLSAFLFFRRTCVPGFRSYKNIIMLALHLTTFCGFIQESFFFCLSWVDEILWRMAGAVTRKCCSLSFITLDASCIPPHHFLPASVCIRGVEWLFIQTTRRKSCDMQGLMISLGYTWIQMSICNHGTYQTTEKMVHACLGLDCSVVCKHWLGKQDITSIFCLTSNF